MIGLIRSELSGFMSQHRLTEYLASIGMPEFERARAQEAAIAEQARELLVPIEETPTAAELQPAPEFTPRRKISNLFSEFAQKFSDTARDRGVELHWIGVGTWKTPVEIVPEKHLEAWKLSQENLYRESPEVLDRLEREAIVQKMVMLIQDVPVAAYQKATEDEREYLSAMRALLMAYRQQLTEAADFIREKGGVVPDEIVQALNMIAAVTGMRDWHWVPHPASEPVEAESPDEQPGDAIVAAERPRTEESAFDELVQLLNGNRVAAERRIRIEGRLSSGASRLELIERAIERIRRERL